LSQIVLFHFCVCCCVSVCVGWFVEFCDRNSTTTKNIIHTTTTLSQARYRLAATSSDEFVFFAGGWTETGTSDRVDIYNVTSGNWTTSTLSIPRGFLAATSSQSLVSFGGVWNA
jgi:hypothetical protein